MTPEVSARKKQLIKLINVGKNALQLDEQTYRAMLKDAVHKDSLRLMTLGELEQISHLLKSKGFKPTSKTNKQGVKRRLSQPSGQVKHPVIDKIVAVWITMGHHLVVTDPSESALDAYVRRMTKRSAGDGVDSVRWLDNGSAYKVLESLKRWHRRELIERIVARGQQLPVNHHGNPASYEHIVAAYEGYCVVKDPVGACE
ncbi:regulatory protein GemA [Shewanella chilikensis]|uniref:gp16 family protein n=1 Tax=Shewanella TaxID=22 RepID=UPI001C5749D0|nr:MULTISPECIES: regulatory protein GemA [Shewanella]MCL1162484.1 regulatory protein GemA [Shewanella chilikensis]